MPIITANEDHARKALFQHFENVLQEQSAKASSEANTDYNAIGAKLKEATINAINEWREENKKKPTPKFEADSTASVVIRIESSGNHLVINQFFSSPESPDSTDQAPDRPVAHFRQNPPSHP